MLPIPFINFIPKIFKDDLRSTTLANKVDTHLNAWKKDVLDINRLQRADEAPAEFLPWLGNLLSANLQDFDSERIKRRKIRDAVSTHKIRGTWDADAKIRIDNITGLDAQIFTAAGQDDWILVGDGLTPTEFYWAALGSDGIDDNLGISLIGEGTEIEVAGNIFIDAHQGINVSTLTPDQINQIVQELKDDVVPAYYRVYIGYVNVSGQFVIYSGGTIE